MDKQGWAAEAAYAEAWAEQGDGVEGQIEHCGCGGACASCARVIAQVRRRAEALIGGTEQ